jgi:hypothetical protein
MTARALLVRAPVHALGVVLAGCPDCRAVIGLDGAPGLGNALAAHRRTCPAGDDVCPGCGCEGELYQRGDGWRCGDCLGEQLADTLTGPPAPARPWVHAVPAWRRDRHQGDADQSGRAVA